MAPTRAEPAKASAPPAVAPQRASVPQSAPPASRGGLIQAAPAPLRLSSAEGGPRQAPLPGLAFGGGQALPAPVRATLEQRLGVDLASVRVHADAPAARAADNLSARAFAYGNHIALGAGQRPTDLGLMAHEVAHVVQQRGAPAIQRSAPGQSDPFEHEAQRASAAVLGGAPFSVRERTSAPKVQSFLGIELPNPLNYLADKANNIPGFRMFTIVLGVNPINMSSVPRTPANIMRALVEFIPGGNLITQALDNHGVFEKVGAWVEKQLGTLGLVGSSIKQAVTQFIDTLSPSDILHLGDVWERAKRIFTVPIDQIINFAKGLVTGIITFIKDAILMPLAKLAEGTRGWDLLTAVLGKNPITGEPVPRNAETLIGGFMKLIGQEEVWENMKKANAIARAWAWFQGAMKDLMGFVQQIPTLAINTFKSLELMDIVLVPRAFMKVAAVFGDFIGKFISWAGNAVWNLLELIFEVVAPTIMPYIKKAAAAFKTILKNPIAFVGNLVRAGKLGFEMFASNILEHLKAALIRWITGPLGDAGVYIPKSFSLIEIIKLVLSVLGLTWQNIRTKLVKIIPEPVLVGLEKTAGILVTLVKDGPAAAWEQIKTELSELKDQMIAQVTQMITTEVVKAAVVKLVSMLNPAGAVVQAIIAIYNTVTFFIQKINQIAAVVASFIDSISAIASGQVDNAAKKVEQTMANTLVVIIAFLAKFAGLGNIPEKLVGVIKKIRQPIDKGLDKIVGWLGKMLEKAKNALTGKKEDKRTEEQKTADLDRAILDTQKLIENKGESVGHLGKALLPIQKKYRLGSLQLVPEGQGKYYVEGSINPKKKTKENRLLSEEEQASLDAVAQKEAAIIKSDPKARAAWTTNPTTYVQDRVAGKAMEEVGQFTLERYARGKGYTIIRSVSIELYDDKGVAIASHQAEIDALLVGIGSVQEIVDIKFDYGKVSPTSQLTNLSFFYRRDLVSISPQKARAFGARDWSSVRSIGVVAGGMRMTLAEFQSRYARATAVSVVGLTTVPDIPPAAAGRLTIGTMAGITKADFIQLIMDAIKKYL